MTKPIPNRPPKRKQAKKLTPAQKRELEFLATVDPTPGGKGSIPPHKPAQNGWDPVTLPVGVKVPPKGVGRVSPEQKRIFWERLDSGSSVRQAAAYANMSYNTGLRIRGSEAAFHVVNEEAAITQQPAPKRRDQLSPEAKRALEDFGYFQRRYFGRIATPWQEMAANKVNELLATDDEEYLVVNAPPGSGKSTLFTMDLAAWMTCRNRAIRGLIGSRTAKQASWYVGRLRRAFERTIPEKAELSQLERGDALDAETTLGADFGRFKPLERDLWTAEQFIVMQESGVAISEKEATWSAFGMDSGFLGGRYDLVIWDDVVDPTKSRTVDQVDWQRAWWGDYAESRLEPGGLLILQGQRIGAEDLYRHCLDMRTPVYDSDQAEDEDEVASWTSKYHHIKFKAHYEEQCRGASGHKLSSSPYPDGCLLYPRRLSWKKLSGIMENRSDRYRVLYQQEDVDPDEVLVNPDWVYARNGFPGCLDRDRDRLDLPIGHRTMSSVVSCDPSPTNNWAVEWWLHNDLVDYRYLIDLFRGKMDAPDFLDYDTSTGQFKGLMEEWQNTSVMLGCPITHWIVEINAAQRFLLQYDFVHRWKQKWRVEIIPHSTQRNKSDAEFGVQTIAPYYRDGKVRLMGKGDGMVRSQRLIDEVTRYTGKGTGTRTDDCIMAHWFFEWNLPRIKGHSNPGVKVWRPSWFSGKARIA